MKSVRVLLIGCGGVGRSLLEQIISNRQPHAANGIRISVVGVCDSKSALLANAPAAAAAAAGQFDQFDIEDDVLKAIVQAKTDGKCLTDISDGNAVDHDGVRIVNLSPGSAHDLRDLIKNMQHRIAEKFGNPGLVVADCSASDAIGQVLAAAVQEDGCCVVLANKKPVTSTLEVYDGLVSTANQRRLRCESTVGAGLPINTMLRRMVSAGDEIRRIAGALSGTLGYVMSGLQDGKPFSEVVRDAKRLGYTEPDPRDDLAGMDVARKALIMARQLGWRLNMEDVKVESLFPAHMSSDCMNVKQFMLSLDELDEAFRGKCKKAAESNCVLRYAATVENNTCCVGLTAVPKDSPLGRLQGSDNLVEIYSRCYASSPLVIQGAGAGNDTTANGVLADILDLQDIL